MRAIAIFVLLLASSSRADDCLSYSGKVILEGDLTRQTFPEQPNYESIAKGDAKATYFFVSLPKPLCVAEGIADANEPAERGIKTVQLVFAHDAKKQYDSLRPSLGMKVSCSGSLFHLISGHHHSPVLLWEAECSPIQPRKRK